MNEETNDFLKENLEEAHSTFHAIISEMKENQIDYPYSVLESMEMNSYHEISDIISKMRYYVLEAKGLREDNSELFDSEYSLYIKYISLYIVSLLFIRLYHEIFDTSKISDMLKYIIGMFLGGTYIGLLNKDINDNRSDTKDKRDLINKLKTMKEEYKDIHDKAVREIDAIFAINGGLWTMLDEEKTKKKSK